MVKSSCLCLILYLITLYHLSSCKWWSTTQPLSHQLLKWAFCRLEQMGKRNRKVSEWICKSDCLQSQLCFLEGPFWLFAVDHTILNICLEHEHSKRTWNHRPGHRQNSSSFYQTSLSMEISLQRDLLWIILMESWCLLIFLKSTKGCLMGEQ